MDLAQLVEAGEAEAYADLFHAAPAPLAEGLGLEVFPVGGGTGLLARQIDTVEFNRVLGLGLDRPLTEADLDAVAARYRPLGLKAARLQLSPQALAQGPVAAWLAARGMTATGGWTKRARRAEALPPVATALSVVDAADAPGRFGATACAGFGMPPAMAPWLDALVGRPNWRCFLAMEGETPVTAGALFLGEDFGWLGIGATRPEARGRGGQGAVMRARLAAAAQAGKPWAITETGAPAAGEPPGPSYRNMDRHGFVEVHLRPNYLI